jgi:hypothetical protein
MAPSRFKFLVIVILLICQATAAAEPPLRAAPSPGAAAPGTQSVKPKPTSLTKTSILSLPPSLSMLKALARSRFVNLSSADEVLLQAYRDHKAVVCSQTREEQTSCSVQPVGPDPIAFEKRYPPNAFPNVSNFVGAGTIHATLIRWLATDRELIGAFAPIGIVG